MSRAAGATPETRKKAPAWNRSNQHPAHHHNLPACSPAPHSLPKRSLCRGTRGRRLCEESVQGSELALYVLLPDGHDLQRGWWHTTGETVRGTGRASFPLSPAAGQGWLHGTAPAGTQSKGLQCGPTLGKPPETLTQMVSLAAWSSAFPCKAHGLLGFQGAVALWKTSAFMLWQLLAQGHLCDRGCHGAA